MTDFHHKEEPLLLDQTQRALHSLEAGSSVSGYKQLQLTVTPSPNEQQKPASKTKRHQQLSKRPLSQRQASKGTFQRILDQRKQEDAAFAEFEAAASKRLKAAPAAAVSAACGNQVNTISGAAVAGHGTASTAQVAAAAGSGGAAAAGGGGGLVVVKRKRGRPPKPRPLNPEPIRPLLYGSHLASVLQDIRATIGNSNMPVGTPVWVKVAGYCPWPGLIWSLELCSKATWPDIVLSYMPGRTLVRFYGEHSSCWAKQNDVTFREPGSEGPKLEALKLWGKQKHKTKLITATLTELSSRADDQAEEADRMSRMGHTYQLDNLQAAARVRHNSMLHPHQAIKAAAAAAAAAADASGSSQHAATAITTTGTSDTGCAANPASGAAAADSAGFAPPAAAGMGISASSVAIATGSASGHVVTGNAWGVCEECRQEVPDIRCSSCDRWFHALCCDPPALTAAEFPTDHSWNCPSCHAVNAVTLLPESDLLQQAGDQGAAAERFGLTPDWIIATAAFKVFQLQMPTPEQPYIAGLLDPSCNSKLKPNIPAERLYDKNDDGLDPTNSWAGYYVILNPEFKTRIQWKFVNRAIDEVENNSVPAVLLICRNSTDTAYYQRLRPYPRVLLRRSSAQFKDYDKSPIGFGVVVFCVAKSNCKQLYERFYEEFAPWGEPNIPIDTEFLASPAFYQLLARLRRHAEQHSRDHWVQCSLCGLWRIITWQQLYAVKGQEADWTCSMLRPPHSSCTTRQTKAELAGLHNGAIMVAAAAAAVPGSKRDGTPASSNKTLQAPALAHTLEDHTDQGIDRRCLPPTLQQHVMWQPILAACMETSGAPAGASFMAADASAAAAKVGVAAALVPPAAAGLDAAGLVIALHKQVCRLQHNILVAYLCKAAAGQLTAKSAAALLAAVERQSNQRPEQQQQQRHKAVWFPGDLRCAADMMEPATALDAISLADSMDWVAAEPSVANPVCVAAGAAAAASMPESPGLQYLAAAARQQVSEWLLHLVTEQLQMLQRRQQHLQQAVWQKAECLSSIQLQLDRSKQTDQPGAAKQALSAVPTPDTECSDQTRLSLDRSVQVGTAAVATKSLQAEGVSSTGAISQLTRTETCNSSNEPPITAAAANAPSPGSSPSLVSLLSDAALAAVKAQAVAQLQQRLWQQQQQQSHSSWCQSEGATAACSAEIRKGCSQITSGSCIDTQAVVDAAAQSAALTAPLNGTTARQGGWVLPLYELCSPAAAGAAPADGGISSTQPPTASGYVAHSAMQQQAQLAAALLRASPMCLSQGAVLAHTADPLLQAIMLEQPGLLKAVTGFLQQVCARSGRHMQGVPQQNAVQQARPQQQQHQRTSSVQQLVGGLAGSGDIGRTVAGGGLLQDKQNVSGAPCCDLQSPGPDIICWDSLDRITSKHSVFSNSGNSSRKKTWQQQDQTAEHSNQDGPGGQGSADAGQSDEEEHYMSAISLAREARVAANHAYLKALGLAPSAVQQGLIEPLQPNHVALVAAARKLAKTSAVAQAEKQLARRQQLLDAARQTRRMHEAQLRSALDALLVDESHAQQLVLAAQETLTEVKSKAFAC